MKLPRIIIPTLGRDRIATLDYFPEALRSVTTLVTNKAQGRKLHDEYGVDVMVCPHQPEPGQKFDLKVHGISRVRQWVLDQIEDRHVVMADDDLSFQIRINRKNPRAWQSVAARRSQVLELIKDMSAIAYQTESAMVGLSARAGNNRYQEGPLVHACRMTNIWWIDLDAMRVEGIRFDRVHTMQDFWVHLSLLSKGYKTSMITDRMYDQKASNAAGGCSLFRTNAVQEDSVAKLCKEFPDFCTRVVKKTKGGWFGGERTDIRIQWKKAYEYGRRQRLL